MISNQTTPAPHPPKSGPAKQVGRFRLKRELTDDELASTGVQKMLLEEHERLLEENSALQAFRDKFESTDKQLAVATAKLKHNRAVEVVATSCLAVGCAALGYVQAVWSNQPSGWIALIFGTVLVCVGLVAKGINL